MKYSFLIFIFICNFSFSQIDVDSVQRIVFKINFPSNVSSVEEIDFEKEKPECKFELKGKLPLQYSFHLENDSIASLYQFKNDKFQLVEKLNYQPIFWAFNDNNLISNFKIVDFDNDGDDDLVCWIFSNINGNKWSIIFINDQKQQKLIRLYNAADKTDIWSKPQFDKQTNTINTELFGSAFGISEESSYKLNADISVTPLKKHLQDRSQKNIIDYEYIGKNGKWKLKSKSKYEG